ncbi:MAG: hypothetical protein HYS57_01860 [Parcubacteria group bacterium]|nr:hypothetical protein [Parcubacteria group bacterium]
MKLTATSTREYAATGEGEVKSKARGSIEIFNEFNAQSQTLVENTRFLSTDGKLFRLTKRTTVPEGKMVDGKLVAGSIVAEVVADQAGPDFNIQPGRFTVPGFQGSPRYSKFYGVSRESFKGGAIGRAKFVRADDVKTAEEDAVKRAFEELKTAISQSLPETVRLVEGALRIEVNRLNSSQKAGDAVDKFVVSVSAGITALVFDETHVREKAKELLPRDQAFFTPSLDVKYEVGDAGFSDGTLKVRAQGNADVAKSIDMAGLKQALLGKKEAGVKREILRIPGIKEAKVRFWPFWARKMPTKLSRIEIVAK